MTYREQHAEWADRTFGHAQLGDERRVDRLVAMAAQVAERPAGAVTQVFDTSAGREGAFRLLESDAASPDAIRRAAFEATALASRKSSRLFVAIDGSSLTLTDRDDRLAQSAPDAQAWYQLDRGADCWPVIQLALDRDLLITIRATHDRRLLGPEGQNLRLRQEVKRQRVLGHYEITVPRRGRAPRRATIALRSCRVTIHALVGSKRRQTFTLNVVMAEETGRRQQDKICWVLLTTHPVAARAEAHAVVRAYALRWRIEDFHRAWKRGLCNVEKSQLRGRNAIIKWATILATVAARALRLAHLLRTAPEAPATTEFTKYEIEACYILSKQRRDRRKTVLLGELLSMIAELGGFANKYSGKPPGPTVLGRGLESVMVMAKGLQHMEEMR